MCEECQIRPATVHITKIVNNEKTQMHLCEECAKQKHLAFSSGFSPFGFDGSGFSIGKLLSSFFESPEDSFMGISEEQKCDRCGLTFSEFTKSGRFGCSHCYETFKGQMDPLLRRIHGKTYHIGKVPRRTGGEIRVRNELSRLRGELQEAINAEEYERAAVLRDKIKEIEKTNKE